MIDYLLPFLLISLVAAIAPFLSARTGRLRVPVMVFEIVLGVLIGPQCLGLVEFGRNLPYLSTLGMAFLFFLAGTEIDIATMRGRPLRLATQSWIASLALASVLAFGLSRLGVASGWMLVAVALSTTALGIVVPVLRDAGMITSDLGKQTVAMGALGEIGPIVLMSVLLSEKHGIGAQLGFIVIFILLVVGVFWASTRVRPKWFIRLLTRTMSESGQLPIRIILLLIACLAVLAEKFGLDLSLGAFTAGMAVGLAMRGVHHPMLRDKFDALGFGFLVPIFFISSGLQLDVGAVLHKPVNIAMMFIYAAMLLLIRGLPSFLFADALSKRKALSLGFFAATSLPLIVALTNTAVRRGLMASDTATALVGGGLISVLVFPVIATRLAREL